MDVITTQSIVVFFQVIAIDLVLAGDNAIVIGLAAAGLPAEQRRKAIFIGIIAATVLRILFATVASQLMNVVGLLFVGGLLLLWVCWKMWRELRISHSEEIAGQEALAEADLTGEGQIAEGARRKTLGAAVRQIVIADVSMSLDNVLAVAGAAHEHPWLLVMGLAVSIALMGLAATLVARLLNKHRWIAYVGLLIILYVALDMIWRGAHDVWPNLAMLGG